jgi:CRISPR-associated protein Cas2
MSFSEQRSWLVAYDVANPRRLGRVHRYLKRHAIPVQYSVFVMRGNEWMLRQVLEGIEERIDPGEDDVRAYHLPNRCEVAMLGSQHLPEGIVLPVDGLNRLLHELTDPDHPATVIEPVETEKEV